MARSGRRGQVAVEAALGLPAFVFLALGVLQLALVEQARLLTEYAAFQAARSGAVWNGDNERMRQAALLSLVPSVGPSAAPGQLGETVLRMRELDRAMQRLPWGVAPTQLGGSSLVGLVRVDPLQPTLQPARTGLPEPNRWQELDFDTPDEAGRVLEVRVRYWYELRIPFGGWGVFAAWYAAEAGQVLFGALDRPRLDQGAVTSGGESLDALAGKAGSLSAGAGLPLATVGELNLLWELARGRVPLEGQRRSRLFLPLAATRVMHMQSNFHRRWALHEGSRAH